MNYKEIQLELTELEERKKAGDKSLPTLLLQCRHDFLTFAQFVSNGRFKPYKVHEVIARELTEIANGNTQKLMLSTPPRTGKSEMSGKLFLAWAMGRSPTAQHIVCSYGQKLSLDITRGVLANMCTDRYKAVFPEIELLSKEKVNEIRNRSGGIIRVTSARSNVTGLGFGVLEEEYPPGILLVDDILADGYSKAVKESTWNWTVTQLLTRALPNNAQLMIGTRMAQDDIHARLLENQQGLWKTINIPALSIARNGDDPLGRAKLGLSHWPEYFPVSRLKEIRSANERNFQCLYQGIPTNADSGLFSSNDFTIVETPSKFSFKFAAIDTATSKAEQSDESVLAVFGVDPRGTLYILDVVRGRYDFAELTEMVKHQLDFNSCSLLLIENANIGKALGNTIKKDVKAKIEYVNANKDKFTRASQILLDFRSPAVAWSNTVSDMEAIQTQFKEFPFGADDVVDAVIYGVLYWQEKFKKADKAIAKVDEKTGERRFFITKNG